MEIPSLSEIEINLRHCLLLKADDLYFTLADPAGSRVRNEFLGIEVEGLADQNLSEAEIASIDLARFAISDRVRLLFGMLERRQLSLHHEHRPDVEFARNDALDFLEHFLSTLPDVALGGLDLTAVRNGEVRRIYELAYAWLNLIETIEGAFYGQIESSLTVGDLALLSGLDTRTIRNRCGPDKLIRTSAARTSQDRNSASPAFVHLHALDAVDWLRSRKDFHVSAVDPGWITQRLANANPANSTRGLLMASIVNLGPLASLAPAFDFTVEDARRCFDQGELLPASISEALIQKIQKFEGTL